MPQFLVAIHLHDSFDPKVDEDQATRDDISALNEEMVAAGVRVFVGGLQPAREARTLRKTSTGSVAVTDGPFAEAKEHVGGFWVLETADMEAALEWGRKAVIACRAPVEVRPFH